MQVSKNVFLQSFGIVVIILALYRCAVLEHSEGDMADKTADTVMTDSSCSSKLLATERRDTLTTSDILHRAVPSSGTVRGGERQRITTQKAPHPIYSVPSFKKTFPDTQDDHLAGVKKWGVKAVQNREEAEKRLSELVYIGASPYYYVEPLKQSIPYLVPQAALLLHDIGRNFFDSLYVKGVPLHKVIVSSALRTHDDVQRLKKRNFNATDNSCHLYGTTIDVCYNRYLTVSSPSGPQRRKVQNDTLKWILSEVLRDLRERDRCYVKHEVKQGCFHITVKN